MWRKQERLESAVTTMGLFNKSKSEMSPESCRSRRRRNLTWVQSLCSHSQSRTTPKYSTQLPQQEETLGPCEGLRQALQYISTGELGGDVDWGPLEWQGHEEVQSSQQGPLHLQDVPAWGLGHHGLAEPTHWWQIESLPHCQNSLPVLSRPALCDWNNQTMCCFLFVCLKKPNMGPARWCGS